MKLGNVLRGVAGQQDTFGPDIMLCGDDPHRDADQHRQEHRRDHRVERDDRPVPPAREGHDGEEHRGKNRRAAPTNAIGKGHHQENESRCRDIEEQVAERHQHPDIEHVADGLGRGLDPAEIEEALDGAVNLAAHRQGLTAANLVEDVDGLRGNVEPDKGQHRHHGKFVPDIPGCAAFVMHRQFDDPGL